MNYDICVFGGCALDQTFFANEDGNYEKKPNVIVPGGKAANQAVAAARAGSKVAIVTRLGKDSIGEQILDNLTYNGINTSSVEMVEGLNNDVANIYIDEKNKDNNIQRITGAIDSFTPDMVEKYSDVILNSRVVVAQMKAPKDFSVELINFCNAHNIPIVITPCRPAKLSIAEPGNKELIDKITLITCNRQECETMFGTKDIEACVSAYPNKLIVTLGKDGVIYHNGNEIVHIPAPKTDQIVDTTGAGDTFNGNLVSFLLKGDSLQDAIYKAQFASSMKLKSKTAQAGMPYKDELEEYIKKYHLENEIQELNILSEDSNNTIETSKKK